MLSSCLVSKCGYNGSDDWGRRGRMTRPRPLQPGRCNDAHLGVGAAALQAAIGITKMYSVSPVVKVAVKGEDEDGKDWPKLVKGLMVLSKADPVAGCTTEENGEHFVAGCGELNLEVCLKGVRGDDAQCDFAESDPGMS